MRYFGTVVVCVLLIACCAIPGPFLSPCFRNLAEASEGEVCDGGTECWLFVLVCGKGRMAPQGHCVDVDWIPCGICFGWGTE
jgi:hypothetical protein